MATRKRNLKSAPVQIHGAKSTTSFFGSVVKYLFALFYLAFFFSSETCIYPLRWLIAMTMRGLIFYFILFSYEEAILNYFTLPDGHSSVLGLPVALFFMWYFITSLLMFMGALYSGFGRVSTENESRYSEFEKLADYANNKMRFQSYKESMDMLTGGKNKK